MQILLLYLICDKRVLPLYIWGFYEIFDLVLLLIFLIRNENTKSILDWYVFQVFRTSINVHLGLLTLYVYGNDIVMVPFKKCLKNKSHVTSYPVIETLSFC